MNKLAKEIEKARPKLRVVSPLAHAVVLVFGVFNILLGISLILAIYQARVSSPLLIVNNVFTYDLWGYVFIGIGLLKLYALRANKWELARKTLLVGVAVKAAWALALIIRVLISPGTVLIAMLWICLAAIQIVTYIFFMPPSTEHYLQRREERDNA